MPKILLEILEVILWIMLSGMLIIFLIEEQGKSIFSWRMFSWKIKTFQDWRLVFSCLSVLVGCWLFITALFHNATLNITIKSMGVVLEIIGGKFVISLGLIILGVAISGFVKDY